MADKIVAVGSILSPGKVRVSRLHGKLLGQSVADTWTPPATAPYVGCRGKRPCLNHCTASDTIREMVSNAVTFTVAGAADTSCTVVKNPTTGIYAGYTLTGTLSTSGFTQVNGTYVAAVIEDPAVCDVIVDGYTTEYSATITYSVDITSPGAYGTTTNCTVSLDVILQVTIRGRDWDGIGTLTAYGGWLEINLLKAADRSPIQQIGDRYVYYAQWPCRMAAGFADQTQYGLGDGSTTRCNWNVFPGFPNEPCGNGTTTVGIGGCCPFDALVISRVWS